MPYGGAIHSTISADLVQTDVDALIQGITGASPDSRTLADLEEQLSYGLVDLGGFPYLQKLIMDVMQGLISWQGIAWLETINDNLSDQLSDPWSNESWLGAIHFSLSHYLADSMGYPWFESIESTLDNGLIDSWGTPWMDAMLQDMEYYFNDGDYPEPWLRSVKRSVDEGLLDELSGDAWLANIHSNIEYGLLDEWGNPWFDSVRYDLDYLLFNWDSGTEPWLKTLNQTVQDRLYEYFFNADAVQPWFQTIHDEIDDFLYDSGGGRPWLETLYMLIDGNFHNYLHDPNLLQPWFQSISDQLVNNLYDWNNSQSWMETLVNEISALRTVLEDVHDSAQHALRTV